MFDGLWFRSRAADRQRTDSLAGDIGRQAMGLQPAGHAGLQHLTLVSAAFDEFSAPEGGFGRLDALLGERQAHARMTAAQDDAQHRAGFGLPAPESTVG